MTPKNYIMYQFEQKINVLKRVPTEEEFYEECKKESPLSTMQEQVKTYYGTYEKLKSDSDYLKRFEDTRKYIISKLLQLDAELNVNEKVKKTPTQEEFVKIVDRYYIRSFFGCYNELLKEAGLKPNKEGVGRKKRKYGEQNKL